MSELSLVSIVVNFMEKEIPFLPKLLDSINSQTYRQIELVFLDKTTERRIKNEVQSRYSGFPINLIPFSEKAGFSTNYNKGISESRGEFVLVLNPDTMLEQNCVMELVNAFALDNKIGCISPKLMRMDIQGNIVDPPVIDSAGMTLSSLIRHNDRGENDVDTGQYERPCYVFGVTGAAAFFKRSCLEDIKFDNQFYDEDYWFTREDADISWRLNNYGWKCFYWPKAVVYHARTVKPGSRKNISPSVNMHGVKNRYMLLTNNISGNNYMRYFYRIIFRDILVFLGVFLAEWDSIEAYVWLWKNRSRILNKRRRIQSRMLSDTSSYWFDRDQVLFQNK